MAVTNGIFHMFFGLILTLFVKGENTRYDINRGKRVVNRKPKVRSKDLHVQRSKITIKPLG